MTEYTTFVKREVYAWTESGTIGEKTANGYAVYVYVLFD